MNQSLVDRVNALLRHYFTPVESDKTRDARMRDWVDDLSEFTPECVDRACEEWRRAHPDKRPTPGHIRELCIADRERGREGPKRARRGRDIFKNNAAEDALERERERIFAEAEAHRDNFARQQGFKDYGDYLRYQWGGSGGTSFRRLAARPVELPPRILTRAPVSALAPTVDLPEEPPF